MSRASRRTVVRNYQEGKLEGKKKSPSEKRWVFYASRPRGRTNIGVLCHLGPYRPMSVGVTPGYPWYLTHKSQLAAQTHAFFDYGEPKFRAFLAGVPGPWSASVNTDAKDPTRLFCARTSEGLFGDRSRDLGGSRNCHHVTVPPLH